jgi:hypothetical protein
VIAVDKRAARRAAYLEIATLVETCLPVDDPIIDWRAEYTPADVERIEEAMHEITSVMFRRSRA